MQVKKLENGYNKDELMVLGNFFRIDDSSVQFGKEGGRSDIRYIQER